LLGKDCGQAFGGKEKGFVGGPTGGITKNKNLQINGKLLKIVLYFSYRGVDFFNQIEANSNTLLQITF